MSQFKKAKVAAIKHYDDGNHDASHKFQKEAATHYHRAAIQRLGSKMVSPDSSTSLPSPPKVASAPCQVRSPQKFSTAEFGETKKRYRLKLPTNQPSEALDMV